MHLLLHRTLISRRGGALTSAATLALCASVSIAQDRWDTFAGSPTHSLIAPASPASIATPAWTRSTDNAGLTITFVGQSAPVVYDQTVLAIGSVRPAATANFFLYALDRGNGSILWAAPIPSPALDSWSAPTIDFKRRRALVATGTRLTCLDLATGSQVWQTTLARSVVNASPVVTTDLPLGDRAFSTDYDGSTSGGKLYCINASPRSTSNPFDPGQIVWAVPLNGSSGNTPAYFDRRVYVTTAGNFFNATPGEVRAYPADAITAPAPLWSVADPSGNGFFGGVSILPTAAGTLAFAATYEFFAGAEEPYSAALLKINATTGSVVWSAPCPRTSTTPVPLPDGRVVLSAGINGYGSVPSLLLYRDLGSSASLLWDSALASWIDMNGNQQLDPGEFTSTGGWTNQPAIARASDGSLRLYAGTIPTASNAYAACSTLRAFNLSAPGSPATLATYPAGGSSPAIAGENLYTISAAGLLAFGPTPPRADVNADGLFDINDLYAWEQGSGARDVNRDGTINGADRQALTKELRRGE
jgi:outer membrane protein assembly factor BamB